MLRQLIQRINRRQARDEPFAQKGGADARDLPVLADPDGAHGVQPQVFERRQVNIRQLGAAAGMGMNAAYHAQPVTAAPQTPLFQRHVVQIADCHAQYFARTGHIHRDLAVEGRAVACQPPREIGRQKLIAADLIII